MIHYREAEQIVSLASSPLSSRYAVFGTWIELKNAHIS